MINKSKLKVALLACRKSFFYVGLFSFFVNLLMLTVPLYMMQIYDRVLGARSYDTLTFLTMLAIFALVAMGWLDGVRARVLVRISHWLDNSLSPCAFVKGTETMLKDSRYSRQSMRDVSALREFLSGNDVINLFDIPWTPIYIAVIFFLHPVLGYLATGGVIILFFLSLLNELSTRKPVAEANKQNMEVQQMVESTFSNAESVQAMGMMDHLVRKWYGSNQAVLQHQSTASNRSSTLLALAKVIRMSLQIAVLGVGAYLVLQNVFTPGSMIAASILTSRAMAPVEKVIGTWKRFVNVRESYRRLKEFLGAPNPYSVAPFLTDPKGALVLENVYYRPQDVDQPIIKGASFQLSPGESVAIIGPSGAGKSTLSRLMLGVWPATHGRVALDGCDVANTDRSELGKHIGYLPQDVRLFNGTVRENITRMQEGKDEDIVAAAKLAGAHEMILALPKGYNTIASQFGLSGGQQQRIALARALYMEPCFVVLDEPNSSLDEEGNKALFKMLWETKQKHMTMVVVTHQPQLLQAVDKILILNQGMVQAFGPKDKVMEHMQQMVSKQQSQQAT